MDPPDIRGVRLAGKVAIVVGGGTTGDTPGTGSATARLFGAQGATVAVVGRTSEHSDATVAAIVSNGGEASAVLGDATKVDTCRSIVRTTFERYGQVDVLVNNLGVAPSDALADLSEETWDRAVAVNLKSVLLMSQVAAPYLSTRGGGSIVNVGSVAGLQASGSPAYGATKGALVAMTRELAMSLGSQGTRVNCVIPGHLYTPMSAQAGENLRKVRNRLNMLGAEGNGWDAAWAILFLASDESRFITATSLPVDGGVTQILGFAQYMRMK